MRVSARAGMPVWIPDDVAGHCCGVPFGSKGYTAAEEAMRAQDASRRSSAGPTAASCRS